MNYNYNPIADTFDQNQILGYATVSNFPQQGKVKFLYLDKQKNYLYTWSVANQKYELVSSTVQSGTAVQKELGGIRQGATFNNVAVTEIVKRLLYPVEFSAYTIASGTSGVTLTEPLYSNEAEKILEVGQSIFSSNSDSSITINFSTNLAPISNLQLQEYYYGLKALPNNPDSSGPSIPQQRSLDILLNTYTTTVSNHFSVVPSRIEWWLTAKDNLNQPFSSFKYSYKWVYRSIAFCSTNSGLNNIPAAGLRTDIVLENNGLSRPTSLTKPDTNGIPNYIYIFIPKVGNSEYNLELITSSGIKVPFVFTNLTSAIQRVVSSRTTNVLYYMYRSLNPIAGSITINLE